MTNASWRTKNYIAQVFGSVGYKGLAILCSFLSVPLTLNSLGAEEFGVWSTLFSLVSWLVFFDVGVGNGLKNKVAELLSHGNYAKARLYIAAGYTFISLISILLFILLYGLSLLIPWQDVFNTRSIPSAELKSIIGVVLFLMILNFSIGLINSVLSADQKSSMIALGQLGSNLIFLLSVYTLNHYKLMSLSYVSYAFGLSQLASNIILSFFYFRHTPDLRPYFIYSHSHVRPLLKTGLGFFIIQIAMLILFASDKIMIAQLFRPEDVASYDLIYKILSVIIFTHGFILAPLWSAFTNAYHTNDIAWILDTIKKQLLIFLLVIMLVIILAINIEYLIHKWVGSSEAYIDFKLVCAIGLFVVVTSWNNIFATFLNGVGELKLQYYLAAFAAVLNIPLSIGLARLTELGVSSIVIGSVVSQLLAAIFLPLKTKYKLIELR